MGYSSDIHAQESLSKLIVNPEVVPNFSVQDGILKFQNRIWLGSNVALQPKVFHALHGSAIGGHSSFPITYRRVKELFAWLGLKNNNHSLVSGCTKCQQAKPKRVRYPCLLQRLAVPTASWQMISMNFVEGLPKSGGKSCILVVVDKFSKYAHFLPLSHPYTTSQVAKLFMQQIYRLHGIPSSIISDRDKVFTSLFWQELFKLANVTFNMSSSYHPQTDGQTERVNQCMETFLWCFVSASTQNGWIGFTWPNSGTIPVGIQLLDILLSRYCMDTNHLTLALILLLLVMWMIFLGGCNREKS